MQSSVLLSHVGANIFTFNSLTVLTPYFFYPRPPHYEPSSPAGGFFPTRISSFPLISVEFVTGAVWLLPPSAYLIQPAPATRPQVVCLAAQLASQDASPGTVIGGEGEWEGGREGGRICTFSSASVKGTSFHKSGNKIGICVGSNCQIDGCCRFYLP